MTEIREPVMSPAHFNMILSHAVSFTLADWTVWASYPRRDNVLILLRNVQTVWGTHPATHSVGSGVLSCAYLRNEWSYTSTPPAYFNGVGMDNFPFISFPSYMYEYAVQS